jgi:glutathione transport system ATP-binding protein
VLTAKINCLKIRELKGEKILLKDINFEIGKNKVYTILGKNGAGKSSLINSLTRLLRSKDYIFDGNVSFEGKDIYSISEEELRLIRRDKIKYVFQDAHKSFDQLKTLGYYFNKAAKQLNEAEELLSFFLLPPPEKLFTLFPYEISGGMAQRVSFILALLAKPKLIILDEPSASVDSAIINLFLIKIKEFVKEEDKSVLIISQDLVFTKKVSDEIAFLSEGSLTEFTKSINFFNKNQSAEVKEFLNYYELIK